MKITVRNLGPIKEEAHIDLKPLTVLIGPNNAGKTWLAYALSGILGPYGIGQYAHAYAEERVPNIYESLNRAVDQILSEGTTTIDLRQFAMDYGEHFFNEVAKFAPNWMHRFLSTQLAHFDGMNITVNLGEDKEQFLSRITQYNQIRSVAGSLLTFRKKRGEDKLFVYTSAESQDIEGQDEQLEAMLPAEVVKEQLIGFVSTVLGRSLYAHIRVFPTERTSLVSSRFGGRIEVQVKDREKIIELFDALAKELGNPSNLVEQDVTREAIQPVASFMGLLSAAFNIKARERESRERRALSDSRIKRYIQLAEVLEQEILTGSVNFSTPEPDPRREVLFQQSQDITLEIPITSSMVKELSPLVLYLRFLAYPGELLIIDEPEMNLHPAAQVKIIEFLAMLVNAGLNVLITTHSTYVVDHLINLMDAYKHDNQDEIVDMFVLEQKEAFIAQDKVSVYQVDDGKVTNILDSEGIIHWKTFSEVTRLIEKIHFEL